MSTNDPDIEPTWPEELPPRQRAFLTAYSILGSVLQAAKGIINPVTHYRWMETSDLYRRCFEIAFKMQGELLKDELRRRALEGYDEPVIARGKLVVDEKGNPVTRKRFSFALVKYLLKITYERFLEPVIHPAQPGEIEQIMAALGANATQRNTSDPRSSKNKQKFYHKGIPVMEV
jgi:hypothetical protein